MAMSRMLSTLLAASMLTTAALATTAGPAAADLPDRTTMASSGTAGRDATPTSAAGPPTVPDVRAQFQALKHHGEALGWVLPEDQGAPDPSVADHYQGVVRYPGAGEPVLYVTQADDDDPVLPGAPDKGGYLHVVRMGTRPVTGERLRSNLQQRGRNTEHTEPPAADRWLRAIRFDGSLVAGGETIPAYEHPGGMAIVDDVLLMALDTPRGSGVPKGQIVLFDLQQDRLNPQAIKALSFDHKIDNLAAVREPNGTYLVWVNGDGGDVTRFYRTNGPDLRSPDLSVELVQVWDPGSYDDYNSTGLGWPTGHVAHQSSTFIEEDPGQRFLVMGRKDGTVFGDDFIDLFRVDPKPTGGFKLTRDQSKHVYCVYAETNRICNFAAAASAYVSPTGELLVYSVPHDDQDQFDQDFVRMAEFRHRDVNREGSPLRNFEAHAPGPWHVNEGGTVGLVGAALPPQDRPWVELYDDDGFLDRSIMVDFDDRHLFELEDFNHLDDFTDRTTSVRWRLPVGLDVELHQHDNFGGRTVVLKGTGQTQAISHLEHQVVVPGVVEDASLSPGQKLDFSDRTSSMRFVGSEPPLDWQLVWDLDGDFVFGETGAAATHGDEIGPFPVFSAALIDGPTSWPVRLRVLSTLGTANAVTTVEVANLDPIVSIDSIGPVGEPILVAGVPAALAASYLDVPFDTHDATIDWGDGTITAGGVDQEADTVGGVHAYTRPGQYRVEVAVRDDDGGVGTATQWVTVYDPATAAEDVLDRIDDAIADAPDPAVVAALQAARDALDGNNGGVDDNGALDRFATEEYAAALVKLEQVIEALEVAEVAGGLNLSAEKALLGLAAWSTAEAVYADAVAAAGSTPPRGVERKLNEARELIDDGQERATEGAYLAAVGSFRAAVQRLT